MARAFVLGSSSSSCFLTLYFFGWLGVSCWSVVVFLERCRAKSLERSTGQTGKLEQKRKDHVDFGACAFGCLEPKCVDPSLGVICLVCDVWVFIASVCLFSTEFSIQALYNL